MTPNTIGVDIVPRGWWRRCATICTVPGLPATRSATIAGHFTATRWHLSRCWRKSTAYIGISARHTTAHGQSNDGYTSCKWINFIVHRFLLETAFMALCLCLCLFFSISRSLPIFILDTRRANTKRKCSTSYLYPHIYTHCNVLEWDIYINMCVNVYFLIYFFYRSIQLWKYPINLYSHCAIHKTHIHILFVFIPFFVYFNFVSTPHEKILFPISTIFKLQNVTKEQLIFFYVNIDSLVAMLLWYMDKRTFKHHPSK